MGNNYQLSRIHNYVTGLMSEEDMYALEREALEDPFLQDAIDGYKLQRGVETKKLSLLQKRLLERVDRRAMEKSQRFFGWHRLTIGVAGAVLFVVVCSLVLFNHFKGTQRQVREVVLMEANLRIDLQIGGDVVPLQGWTMFEEELNSELRDHARATTFDVSFTVQQGVAKEVSFSGIDPQDHLAKVVSEFIQNKTQWEGAQGKLTVGLLGASR